MKAYVDYKLQNIATVLHTFTNLQKSVEDQLNSYKEQFDALKAGFQLISSSMQSCVVLVNESFKLQIPRADETPQARQNRAHSLLSQSLALLHKNPVS